MNYLLTGIDMKNIKLLLIALQLVVICLSSSCIVEGEKNYTFYRYINQSNINLSIFFYSMGELTEEIHLPEGEYWDSQNIDFKKGSKFWILESDIDSCIINYDNTSRHVFHLPLIEPQIGDDKYNVFNESNYEIIVESDIQNYHLYSFTNEHLENAEPIGDGG